MPKPLTAAQVRNAKPGRHHDGGGLYLNVKPTGAKSWVFRGTINGRRTNRGIGPVALVSLAEARIKALEIRRAIFDGKDPFPTRRAAAAPTFGEAADAKIALLAQGWKGDREESNWRNGFKTHCAAIIDRPVNKIADADVIAVLRPIWNAKRETARRMRGRIAVVMDWAISEGHCDRNPAGKHSTRRSRRPPRSSRTITRRFPMRSSARRW